MTYYYEALNDISFQKFAQALITSVHPETICLPARQPDGGRDAFFYRIALERKHFVVFQVKFSTDPKSKTERDAIESLIKSEQEKVRELIQRGATQYYLVTNVQGTAHLGSGSIDRLNEELSESFSIPSYVWWRDDLDSRLDNASDVKWSYPEICRASDVLQFLLERPENKTEAEASRAITSYLGKQHGDDRDVKFKQVELKRRITELFVDIPLRHKSSAEELRQILGGTEEDRGLAQYIASLDEHVDYDVEDEHPFEHAGLAAAFFLHMPFGRGVTRIVLEGAPGQGKSTVTQFLCQVNRLKLLPAKRSELTSVGTAASSAATRTPFRVDLRDYAAWVTGRHPYARQGEYAIVEEGQRSLEAFLTMQVSWHSGGVQLTTNELLVFFERAHSVIVLDGFDEVADISTRARVVQEICSAADRLDAQALSLQMIVTSRPAAFANSPGFPETEWTHLELIDLRWPHISTYKDKWSEAQDLTPAEQATLTTTLEEKLDQPHLRELSRNPMQLAILLQLMHVQGAALPDKRTALYEEYMKIFLNREVEKKQIAGDHRELILSIHGVLAWVLQIQAETGQGSGSITMESLRSEVTQYLQSEEHDPSLGDILCKGTVERVGALVSRVQGTFEFEVQPLREYFAARHLHKTAPYSPPGHEKRGTRPERFTALANSFYWTNVTRFFCGFYDVGELPSLVDGLIASGDQPEYRLIARPRRLAMMLLGDYVFTQSPKSMRRLIEFIVKEPDFQRLTGAESTQEQRGMELPRTAGGKVLFEVCAEKLHGEKDPAARSALRQVMARNSDSQELAEYWRTRYREGNYDRAPLAAASDFQLVEEFAPNEIKEWCRGDTRAELRWLAAANLHKSIIDSDELYQEALEALFSGEGVYPYQGPYQSAPANKLLVLSELLHPHVLSQYFTAPPEHAMTYGRRSVFKREFFRRATVESTEDREDPLFQYAAFLVKSLEVEPESWRADLSPWEGLVDRGLRIARSGRLLSLLAMISTAVSGEWKRIDESAVSSLERACEADFPPDPAQAVWGEDAFSPTPGLVRRLYYARTQSSNGLWWRHYWARSIGDARVIWLAALTCWGNANTIESLSGEIGVALDNLDAKEWSWFWNMITLTGAAAGPQISTFRDEWFLKRDVQSVRLAIALLQRMTEDGNRRLVGRKYFYEYEGEDPRILQAAADGELLSEPLGGTDWRFVQRLSEQARKHGVRQLFSQSQIRQQIDVPLNVAKCVLEHCDRHNSQFVSLCERSFASAVAQRANKVSAVAQDEMWFADEGAS